MAAKTEITHGAKVSGPIRVKLPISVAHDLEQFQKALANVAGLVGCTGCTSSVDVSFLAAREFVADPASLQARETVTER
ncbi:MAG TPA: hypothetical protein VNY29_05285 [Terriglobales bacterium]|jgi:hypothetical protein|nr:hypothetical protein [Terriglobales bacterium]